MKYRLKTFGIAREIMGGKEIDLEMEGVRVGDLKAALGSRFPALKSLKSLLIAVNSEYAEDGAELSEGDEIALIPPVSGG